MENPKVIICDCDHADVNEEDKVFAAAKISYKWLKCTTQQEVIEQCQGAVALLNQYLRMDEVVFRNIPTLKMVARYGVGVDTVNLEHAAKYGIQVTNVPDYGINEVADHSLALMLSIVRKVNLLSRRVREGVWDYSEAVPIMRLANSTIGVIGLGRIGSAFAHRARALGSKIIGYDSALGKPGFLLPDFIQPKSSVEELLQQADIVLLSCILDESNKNLMNKERFSMMKDGAFLINTSRGGLIDEIALEAAIKSGKLAAAALDVTAKEPIPKNHPLLSLENVIITPHVAWNSVEAAKEMKRKPAEDVVNFLSGRPVRYPVNRLP